MHVTPSSPRMAKSTSLGVLEQDHHHMHIVDQDDIIGLTQDVKNFSDGLAKLKSVLLQPCDSDEDLRVLAHERLGDVLCTLKSVLQRYPPLNTTELFSAAGALISKIKHYNYEEHTSRDTVDVGFTESIDQLALEFSSSVSEYLMGDLQEGIEEILKTKSYDNLLSVSQDTTDKDDTEEEKEDTVVQLTVEEIDSTLMRLQAGLDLAFQRAKAWSKYLKDVMNYIERRAQLEVEYAKNLSRLASTVKPNLTEEGFLPLQSVYCTVLSQDVEYAKTCQATFTLLQATKFVEPLSVRRNDHDRIRKTLKEAWNKEVKKMQEAVSNLRKAQSMYVTRRQEHDKAKDLAQKTETEVHSQGTSSANLVSKMEKRKKYEDEALHKAAEAETTYKACVAEANNRQNVLQKVKSELLASIRDQILMSDQIIKKVTIDYFQLLQTVSAPVPVQYHTLCEASKRYNPGSQYAEFVRRLPVSTSTMVQYEEFRFEPFNTRGDVANRKTSTQSNESASSDHQSEGSPTMSSPRKDKYRVPVKAWSQQGIVGNSDTDSQSGSSKSLDSSPSNSPYPAGHKKMTLTGSMENLIEAENSVHSGVKNLLAIPGTDHLDVNSVVKRQGQRRNTTFGVDFQEQVDHYHSAVPPIISKCLKEVEKRGITVKGIYRVSGVKSTVENLCQRFEMDPRSVSLDTENPNVISNVLKLYLRQLPEPLLTFKLYPEFIQMAKENMSGSLNNDTTIERLHNLIDKLPFSNRKTCGVLMHHLQRIASYSDQNQMNASNLGIVFGPTLLRPQGGNASLACLVDTPHQTRVVELLIIYAETLFGPNEDHQVVPGETPVESLEKRATSLQVPHQSGSESPRLDSKKDTTQSPAVTVTVQKDEIVPPNIPELSKDKDTGPLKRPGDTKIISQKTGEEFYLPGSASYDKHLQSRALTMSHSHSEGEDNELENGYDNDNSADSDTLSDGDLPLPDGSHHSKSIQHEPGLRFGGGTVIDINSDHLTPPLTSRQPGKHLPSPASSPSLSSRSLCSAPPAIRIEESVLNHAEELHTSDTQLAQAKIYQLPPINSWVPKGESLFTNILDSRSPQIYRRTTSSSSKTASFPQSSSSTASARVSWPQQYQVQLSPPISRCDSDTVHSSDSSSSKSPKLLRKCTSFDIERSKPFPARSTVASPRLSRKSTSFDENDGPEMSALKTQESPSFGRKLGASDFSANKDQSVLKEVENEDSDMAEVPPCSSGASLISQTKAGIDAMCGGVELTSGEKQCLSAENSKDYSHSVIKEMCSEKSSVKGSDESVADFPNFEDIGVQTSPRLDTGARPKKNTKNGDRRPHLPKTVPGKAKLKPVGTSATDNSKVSKTASGPIMGRAGLKPVKKERSQSEKTSPRSATASVKSAFMTSAAKLKSIGRRNPVTLLSYKSASITIPDHTEKASVKSDKKGKLVHQSESSPTVLVTSTQGTDPESVPKKKIKSTEGVAEKKVKTAKAVAKSEPQPVFLSVQGLRRSSQGVAKVQKNPGHVSSSHTSATAGEKVKRKDKISVKPRDTGTKSVSKPEKPPHEMKVSGKSGDNVPGSSGSRISVSKKSKDIKEKWGEDKVKGRLGKRDSIGSVHSEPARKTDHFRDCCHGRKK